MAVKADPNSVTRSKTELKRPRMYRVVFYNDDFTPMDFVVDILQHIFGKTPSEAYSLMMSVHRGDYAVVGVYTRDIAYTKVRVTTEAAKSCGYPLKVEAMPDTD